MSAAAIALSGMTAARLGLGASAHNVANAQTQEFRPQKVVMRTQAQGGVTAHIQTQTDSEPGVSLEAEAVAQFELVYIFKANVCVVEVQHSMTGSLLDVKA